MLSLFLKDRPFIPLVTPRLLLRPPSKSDAADIANLVGDIRVSQNLARVPHPYTLQDAYDFIAQSNADLIEGNSMNLSIIRRDNNQLIGGVGIDGEIGYWLGHSYWSQGYAKEAVKALLDFAFFTLKLSEISGRAAIINKASHRIFERYGFKEKGQGTYRSLATQEERLCIKYQLSYADYTSSVRKSDVPIVWVVAAALIDKKGRVLLAGRQQGKYLEGTWELPGGKIEQSETPEQALVRELKEELDITVEEPDLMPLTFASYPYPNFHLLMPLYICREWRGHLVGKEKQDLAWVSRDQLSSTHTLPADIPLFHALIDYLDKISK